MPGNTSKRYPPQRAVRMFGEVRSDYDTDWAAMAKVAQPLGVTTPETVREWVPRAQVDGGVRPGITSEESAEVKGLKRESAELSRANSTLKAASAFFARARPALLLLVDFVREYAAHLDPGGLRWGVAPICSVLSEHGLPIAPSTYYEHVSKGPAGRDCRDAVLTNKIRRVHTANDGVYGPRKVWLTLNREGIPVARCTIERLMRQEGLAGAVRGEVKRTTVPDPCGPRARDLVRRDFGPLASDRLWSRTLRTSRRGRGGCTPRLSSMRSPGASSAGAAGRR